jgi:hypothetical protein
MYRICHKLVFALLLFSAIASAGEIQKTDRFAQGYRFERANWIYVHLEGTPYQIGLAHGHLLAPEIADALAVTRLEQTHDTKRPWSFFRHTAQKMLWPQIEEEYREELKGIADGARAAGVKLDLWDIVALNGKEEVPDYYVPWFDAQQKRSNAPKLKAPGNCSAFVATGAWTRDHRPVIGHNNWTGFLEGERWRIIFDLQPVRGERVLMDGFPGMISSGDDFGINSAQLAVTETTITGYGLYDPSGAPEFVRARKALQYARSIDDYERIFLERNNGGYANDWLLADYKSGEIARLEVGLKLHKLWRSSDGYFTGANFPSDIEFIKAETDFDPGNNASSPNARRIRWEELMSASKGQLDAERGKQLLADHVDSYEKRTDADERSICGHIYNSSRGVPEWEWKPFTPAGSVNTKVADGALVEHFSFAARSGVSCGADFLAGEFLQAHPEFNWTQPLLRDMRGNPWAEFKVADKLK